MLAAALAGCAMTPAPAVLSGDDQTAIAQITEYLNGLHSFRARFVQAGPEGMSAGSVVLARPGRLAVHYEGARPRLIVANHGRVLAVDLTTHATSGMRLSRTPLDILLAPEITLSGGVTITRLTREGGGLQVALVKTAAPGQGVLTLRFSADPLELQGVTLVDGSGRVTALDLQGLQVNVPVADGEFEYVAAGG